MKMDNQRLGGENYILNQTSEGLEIVEKHDDDGGKMERPGLQELFRDIEADLINCVVVYKIESLMRNLIDFSKIVETFRETQCQFC
jgi:DNA invertase Pin-like site-specific DNA recombinase